MDKTTNNLYGNTSFSRQQDWVSLAMLIALFALAFTARAQEGSQGNTTIFGGAQMSFFGNHNFIAGGSGAQPGVILTERAAGNFGVLNFIGTNLTSTGASDAGYVDGYVRKYGTGQFIFPVGDNAHLGQFAASADGTMGAYFFADPTTAVTSNLFTGANYPALPTGGPFPSASKGLAVNTVSTIEYWDIDGTNATPITLTWDATSNVTGLTASSLTKLTIVGWNSATSKWDAIASTVDATSVLGGASALTAGSITTDAAIVPNTYTAYTLAAVANIDLTPTLPRPIATNFTINQTMAGVLRLTNLVASATTGTVTVFLELGAGFELTVDPAATLSAGIAVTNSNWIITDFGGGSFQFESKPGIVVAASGIANLGYTIKATGTVFTTGIITATINNKTGGIVPSAGDFNDNNNIAVKIFSIIP